MKNKAITFAGWYGVLAILGAYGLVSFDVVSADSLPYQMLNLSGAVGLIIETASKKDRPPVVLNIVWAIVAIVAIAKIAA